MVIIEILSWIAEYSNEGQSCPVLSLASKAQSVMIHKHKGVALHTPFTFYFFYYNNRFYVRSSMKILLQVKWRNKYIDKNYFLYKVFVMNPQEKDHRFNKWGELI